VFLDQFTPDGPVPTTSAPGQLVCGDGAGEAVQLELADRRAFDRLVHGSEGALADENPDRRWRGC
jgi:hypothetical protein